MSFFETLFKLAELDPVRLTIYPTKRKCCICGKGWDGYQMKYRLKKKQVWWHPECAGRDYRPTRTKK